MSSPILSAKCMDFDDMAWERSGDLFETWKREKLLKRENLIAIGNMINKWRGGVPDTLLTPGRGAFNAWVRLTFVDGGSAVMRIPCYGKSVLSEEKVRREVAVMRFLERHTNIPIPHVLHYGMTRDSPDHLGPFIIMEYINHEHDLVDALNTPGIEDHERPILDPQISKARLSFAYGQMADIMLQLSKNSFTEIGSIAKVNEEDEFDDSWATKHRPLTFNMNHNDVIESTEDCKRKYIARCLFRKLAREGRLSTYNEYGPFKLFCDDLRPENVLTNTEFAVVGAVDWEFTYAAPVEFAYSPPWWLLLELPEYWQEGLGNWTSLYEERLQTFLKELREKEDTAIRHKLLDEGHRLSHYMKESWESGDFWVSYAARKSWAFDMIFWAKIDRRFFGNGTLEDRFQLLSPEEKEGMDSFVQNKVQEKGKRTLTDWNSPEAERNCRT